MKRPMLSANFKNPRGTVTVAAVLLMLLLIGFAGFAIDIGYLMINRNELQNLADAAALAATRELGSIYSGMSYSDSLAYVADRTELAETARGAARNNGVKDAAGNTINIADSDVVAGIWSPDTRTLTPTLITPNAVNVTVSRTDAANGPVATFLAGVLGIRAVNVSATATAALTNLLKVPEGGLPVPVGIAKAWFSDPEVYCNNPIRLYPTNTPEGCAGWHVYGQSPSSAHILRETINGLTNQTYSSPETISGLTEFDFTGGNVANALRNMRTLFDTMKVKNDGVLDKDDDANTWTTAVPVYDSADCSNPSGTMLIVGFSTIVITNVTSPPAEQVVDARVVCDSVAEGPGGGIDFGTIGSMPNLVQ